MLYPEQREVYLETAQAFLGTSDSTHTPTDSFINMLVSNIPAPMIPLFIFTLLCSESTNSSVQYPQIR